MSFAPLLLPLLCSALLGQALAVDRHYYIGIVEAEWDYWQLPESTLTDQLLLQQQQQPATVSKVSQQASARSRRAAPDRPTYVKALLRQFNQNFTQQLPHPTSLGLLGPALAAAPGDRLVLHVKNFARFPFSIQPRLLPHPPSRSAQVKAQGGEFTYLWPVPTSLGAAVRDEPCLVGAYHGTAQPELEAGLVGPLLICRRDALPRPAVPLRLRSGDRLAFAMPHLFRESLSVYRSLNQAQRGLAGVPSLNGLQQANQSRLTLFQLPSDCRPELGRLRLYTLPVGNRKPQWLDTDCGVMMESGQQLLEAVHLYPGDFRSLSIDPNDLTRQFERGCQLRLRSSSSAVALPLFSNRQNCADPLPSASQSDQPHRLTVSPIIWQYNRSSSDRCTRKLKLKFAALDDSAAVKRSDGLQGPAIWVRAREPFQVTLAVPATLGAMVENFTLDLQMPSLVRELSRKTEQRGEHLLHLYRYVVASPRVAGKQDAGCRPYVYSASSAGRQALDTGLFGPLIICQDSASEREFRKQPHRHLLPLVVDERRSLVSGLNLECEQSQFATVNGYLDSQPDFGQFRQDDRPTWFVHLARPGEDVVLTWSDEGRVNGLFRARLQQPDLWVPGSSVALSQSGATLRMEMGNKGGEFWIHASVIGDDSVSVVRSRFATSTRPRTPSKSARQLPHDMPHFVIMAKVLDWDYAGNVTDPDQIAGGRRRQFRKLVYRSLVKQIRSPEDAHLSILGPKITLTPESPVFVTLMNVGPKPVSLTPGAGIEVTFVEGDVLSDGFSVEPEKSAKFLWKFPEHLRLAQSGQVPSCAATLYTSHHDRTGDLNAGLLGPVLLCPGSKAEQQPPLITVLASFDESLSSLGWLNRLNADQKQSRRQPLQFQTINGRLQGNVDWPGFQLEDEQLGDWFLFSSASSPNRPLLLDSQGRTFSYQPLQGQQEQQIQVADTAALAPGQGAAGLALAARLHPLPAGQFPFRFRSLDGSNDIRAQLTVRRRRHSSASTSTAPSTLLPLCQFRTLLLLFVICFLP